MQVGQISERDSKIFSNFYDSIGAEETKKSYFHSLKQFMAFLKVNKYSDLIPPAKSREEIYESIKSFILHLREKKVSTRTINLRLYALKSFYDMNDIEDIRWKKLKKYRGEETEINEDRGYTYEEIQQILNVSDLRTKAVILLMASSGMRIGALSDVKVKDISASNRKITVYAKTPQKYFTFITPECKQAIQNYLEFRERCGEKITDESPLFRKEFDIDFPEEQHVRKLNL